MLLIIDQLNIWGLIAPRSARYKEKIEKGIIDPSLPIYSYVPGKKGVDAVTSATEKYFAGRGLLYTYRGGRRVDTTHLHLAEWIHGIRTGKQPSCNINRGFEEAITAHMSTISYKENRKVCWDEKTRKLFDAPLAGLRSQRYLPMPRLPPRGSLQGNQNHQFAFDTWL